MDKRDKISSRPYATQALQQPQMKVNQIGWGRGKPKRGDNLIEEEKDKEELIGRGGGSQKGQAEWIRKQRPEWKVKRIGWGGGILGGEANPTDPMGEGNSQK